MRKFLSAAERTANLADALARIERARSSPAEIARLFADGDFDSGLALFVTAQNAGALIKSLTAAMAELAPAVAGDGAFADQARAAAAARQAAADEISHRQNLRYLHPGNVQRRFGEHLRSQNCPEPTQPDDGFWDQCARGVVARGNADDDEPKFIVQDETAFARLLNRICADYVRWRRYSHDDEIRRAMPAAPALPTLLRSG